MNMKSGMIYRSALGTDSSSRPRRYSPRNQPLPLDRRLGGAQSLSGRYGEEKNFLGIEPQVLKSSSP
jgi:hypothetical protein